MLMLFAACTSPYKALKQLDKAASGTSSAFLYKPQFTRVMYRCHVDGRFLLKKFHLSGILFFKNFEDGSTRAIFQNEMGFAFFDFSWTKQDSFEVKSILPQLDKPAVVKTLQKDIALLLMRGINRDQEETFTKADLSYSRYPLQKGYAYYIVQNGTLLNIEAANKRPVTTIYPIGKTTNTSMPDSISIVHHKAHFTINAKMIQDAAAE